LKTANQNSVRTFFLIISLILAIGFGAIWALSPLAKLGGIYDGTPSGRIQLIERSVPYHLTPTSWVDNDQDIARWLIYEVAVRSVVAGIGIVCVVILFNRPKKLEEI